MADRRGPGRGGRDFLYRNTIPLRRGDQAVRITGNPPGPLCKGGNIFLASNRASAITLGGVGRGGILFGLIWLYDFNRASATKGEKGRDVW